MNKSAQKDPGESQAADRATEREHRQESATHPILQMQRAAGNQAVTRMLRERFVQAKFSRSKPGSDSGNLPDASASSRHSRNGTLQRTCACGGGKAGMSGGNCEECSKNKGLGLQAKLDINEPGDIYEQEADRIADQAMAGPTQPALSVPPIIQRFEGHAGGQKEGAPESVDYTLANSGRPLEPALRHDMEQRLGHDFSSVRVHSSAAAEQSARDVNAHAYTVGNNIVFGAGRFSPGTYEGRRLVAHELTHVVQQSSAGNSVGQSYERRGFFPGSISREPLPISTKLQRMVQRSPDKPTTANPVKTKRSGQTHSTLSFMISFDKALTRDEFIELAEITIYGRRTPGDWTGVPNRLKASDSPVEVWVPEATVKSELRQTIAELPQYIQKALTTGEGTVGSHEDLKSVVIAGNILYGAGVTPDELLLLEYELEEAKRLGQPQREGDDLVAWAEAFVVERQESAEKALEHRINIVGLRERLDQWSQDEKNGIKNVAEGHQPERIMHMLLGRHGMSYYSLMQAFEVELKAITTAFLSQAQVALLKIEKTYLANKNVGVEKELLRQTVEKIRPAMGQRDVAAAELELSRTKGIIKQGPLYFVTKDPEVEKAEANLEAKDEELQKQSEAAGLPVVTWKGFDWDAIRGGKIESTRSALRSFVYDAHSKIRSAQDKVTTLKTLYKADRMVAMTKASLGIEKGSVFDDIISYRARIETSDDGFWSTLWDIVTIALMFVPGNIGIALRVGAGLIDATKAMNEYSEGRSLSDPGLATEPSKFGVFLAVGGVLIDVPEMGRGTIKVLGSKVPDIPAPTSALREGEQALVKVADDPALKTGKTVEGPGESLVREQPPASSVTEAASAGKLATPKTTDPKVAEEMNKLGPVDTVTKQRLESDPSLRKALADNQLAASALKKCKSPCFPEMTAEQVELLEHILKGYKKTGDYDETLVKQFLADNRENLDDAIHALNGWTDSKGLDSFLRYAAEGGDIRKIAPKLDPKLVSEMQRRAHDIGVKHGHEQAIKDGLSDVKLRAGGPNAWENPIKVGGFDQGFDNIMVKGDIDTGEVFIVEYKGGKAGLSPGQMSLEWVKGNIKRLSLYEGVHGREMAEKLAKALREGRLRGVVYSTPVVGLRETKKIGGELIYAAVNIRLPPLPVP